MAVSSSSDAFPSLVSAAWLKENLASVRILDATWYMPNVKDKNAVAEFCTDRIPGSQYFDLDLVADTSVDLPHMLPSERQFAAVADALRITNDDQVVVYDRQGIFSAPRAWWTWHVMGHKNVAVLDGGMPAWKAEGGELDTTPQLPEQARAACKAAHPPPPQEELRYKATLLADEVRSWLQLLENVRLQEEVVMDARPAARWRGEAAEPRPGLASGHIPGSCNVPWDAVVHHGHFRRPEELKRVFKAAGVDLARPLVASCGSGTTACILALAVKQVQPDAPPVAIYDGSWSEWGGLPDVPVATAVRGDD